MDRFERDSEDEAIETELRYALRHVAAPEGFTEKVLARAAARNAAAQSLHVARTRRGAQFFGASPRGAWLSAVAALLLVTVGGGDLLHVHHQRQQREAAAAEAKVDLAMQLTSHALAEVEIGLDRSPAGRFTHLVGTGN